MSVKRWVPRSMSEWKGGLPLFDVKVVRRERSKRNLDSTSRRRLIVIVEPQIMSKVFG